MSDTQLRPIGVISSDLTSLDDAPMQGNQGAPDAWLDIDDWASAALRPRRRNHRHHVVSPRAS